MISSPEPMLTVSQDTEEDAGRHGKHAEDKDEGGTQSFSAGSLPIDIIRPGSFRTTSVS